MLGHPPGQGELEVLPELRRRNMRGAMSRSWFVRVLSRDSFGARRSHWQAYRAGIFLDGLGTNHGSKTSAFFGNLKMIYPALRVISNSDLEWQ
jgi:hypothetical protein